MREYREMVRPRRAGYRDLPINLYFDAHRGGYLYIHPITKKKYSVGKNKLEARTAALKLNAILLPETDIVKEILKPETMTVRNYIENIFLPRHLIDRNLAPRTLRDHQKHLRKFLEVFGDEDVINLTTKSLADYLLSLPIVTGNQVHSLLLLLCKYLISDGWLETNPIQPIMRRKFIKKRERLSYKDFITIHNAAPNWLKIAMDLALYTLQRPDDLVNLTKSEDGLVYVIQGKTKKHGIKAKIRIKPGQKLRDLLAPFKPGELILGGRSSNTVSRAFSDIRDSCGLYISWDSHKKPTLYEIRSLGIEMYEQLKKNSSMDLSGHSSESMKDYYREGHENSWTDAESI